MSTDLTLPDQFAGMELITGQIMKTSQRTYNAAARNFAGWMHDNNLTPPGLSAPALVAYRTYLLQTYSNATGSLYLSIALQIIKRLAKEGIIAEDFTEDIRGIKANDETTHRILSEEETERLLNAPDLSTLVGWRDLILLYFLYFTGAREAEACRVQLSDFEEQYGVKVVRLQGKGNKTRLVPLPDELTEMLTDYLKKREEAGITSTSLLIGFDTQGNYNRASIGERTIQRRVEKYAEICTLPGLSPHGLRGTKITQELDNGTPLHVVQYWSGHRDARTTQRYHDKSKAMKQASNLKGRRTK